MDQSNSLGNHSSSDVYSPFVSNAGPRPIAGVPHPIPYQGSKRQLARFIVSLFPPDAKRLVEPFAWFRRGIARGGIFAAHAPVRHQRHAQPSHRTMEADSGAAGRNRRHLRTHWTGANPAMSGFFMTRCETASTSIITPRISFTCAMRCVKAAIRYNSRARGVQQQPRQSAIGRRTQQRCADTSTVLPRYWVVGQN